MGHGFHGYVSHNQRAHVIISQGFPAAETSRESCDFNRGCNISSQDLGGVSTGVSVGERHQMCGFNIVNGLTFHGKIDSPETNKIFPVFFPAKTNQLMLGICWQRRVKNMASRKILKKRVRRDVGKDVGLEWYVLRRFKCAAFSSGFVLESEAVQQGPCAVPCQPAQKLWLNR